MERKTKTMIKKALDFNLQLFAEPAPEPAPEPTPNPEPTPEPTPEPEKKYTDDDVDKIIEKKKAKWKAQMEKEKAEAEKLANMTAQQKSEHEKKQLEARIAELEREKSLAEMRKTARGILAESNINISDELVAMMVTDDAEETKAAIDGFVSMFNDAVEAAVKERLKGKSPIKGTGGSEPTPMTKEQIMEIADPELRQQKMLENRHLFNI